jgi:TonB family protein
MPAGSAVRGEVVHQAMPEVLESARNSIRGKLRVSVKVNVDRSGNVEDAELESRGPSKYFARAAVDAARNWKFRPAKVGGQGVLSTWLLRFEFTRGGTTVVPTQEMP